MDRNPGIAIFTILSVLALAACSSPDKEADNAPPSWTRQPARTVDGGYIVYVGTGEDRQPDKASFKAESMALQDLSNECSFVPKGARVEDHFDETSGIIYRSYAKVAVEYQDCEAAKAATTPEQIRTLANAQMTDEIKRYQELVDEPEPQEAAPLQLASADGSGGSSVGGTGAAGASSTYAASGPPISSDAQFFIVREQLVFAKQEVILAPPATYPPQAPQTLRPIPVIAATSQSIRQYSQAHPEIQKGPQAFSTSRPNWFNHRAAALRETQAERARISKAYPRWSPASASRKNESNSGKRRRRRRWSESQ